MVQHLFLYTSWVGMHLLHFMGWSRWEGDHTDIGQDSWWPTHVLITLSNHQLLSNNDQVNGLELSRQPMWWAIAELFVDNLRIVWDLLMACLWMGARCYPDADGTLDLCSDYSGDHQTISEQAGRRPGAVHEQPCHILPHLPLVPKRHVYLH